MVSLLSCQDHVLILKGLINGTKVTVGWALSYNKLIGIMGFWRIEAPTVTFNAA